MGKYVGMLVKSIFLGILVTGAFLYFLSFIINSGDIVGIIIGISITSTIFFCTFMIIGEIKKIQHFKNWQIINTLFCEIEYIKEYEEMMWFVQRKKALSFLEHNELFG